MIYFRVAGAMAVAGALRLLLSSVLPLEALHVEVHGVAAYLTVVGGLYGIMAAFLLFVVWEQFNHVQMGLEKEASALEDLCRVAGFLAERDSGNRIRLALRRYVKVTESDEPQRLAARQASAIACESFAALTQAVRGAELQTQKDRVVYDELLRALARVMEARDERLTVSATRVPETLWNMVVFVSVVLFGGFLALGIHSVWLSILLVAAAAGILTFLLAVIKDMDDPFAGVWNVSYAPMTDVAARVG